MLFRVHGTFQPCAGGELTHRKRSPLPFREGFFCDWVRRGLFGRVEDSDPAPGADSPTASGPPSLSGRVFLGAALICFPEREGGTKCRMSLCSSRLHLNRGWRPCDQVEKQSHIGLICSFFISLDSAKSDLELGVLTFPSG